MSVTILSRLQFATTSIYHFFFVPLTLGLSVLVAIMETQYVRTGKEVYKRMTKFWARLFLINFAMGVVTGIVQEFQFGMNWAEYSRFIGDVFGVPLAIEALMAFFLESTLLGVWIFGWDKLPKTLHALIMWLVASAASISAMWILIANSFMHHPVGFMIQDGKAVLTDFWALINNPHVWVQIPHTILSGFTTASFFILGISAYHLLRQQNYEDDNSSNDFFQRSFRMASIFGLISVILIIYVGDAQGKEMARMQPMKTAAAEALMQTEDPAGFSLITIVDQASLKSIIDIRIPYVLSLLIHNRPYGVVQGIQNLQKEFVNTYGPGNYVPPILPVYLSFRTMVGAGFLMLFIATYFVFLIIKRKSLPEKLQFRKINLPLKNIIPLILLLPYIANTTGWLLTEMGRQPWIVYGLLKTEDGVSSVLSPGMIITSLIGFALVYAILMAVDIYLLVKTAKTGPQMDTMPSAEYLEKELGV